MGNSHSINNSLVLLLSCLMTSIYLYIRKISSLSKQSEKTEICLEQRQISDDFKEMIDSDKNGLDEIEQQLSKEDIPISCSPEESADFSDNDGYDMISEDEISKAMQLFIENEFENNIEENDRGSKFTMKNDKLKESLESQKQVYHYFTPWLFKKTPSSESFPLLSPFTSKQGYGIL